VLLPIPKAVEGLSSFFTHSSIYICSMFQNYIFTRRDYRAIPVHSGLARHAIRTSNALTIENISISCAQLENREF